MLATHLDQSQRFAADDRERRWPVIRFAEQWIHYPLSKSLLSADSAITACR